MKAEGGTVLQLTGSGREKTQTGVHGPGGSERTSGRHHVAARDIGIFHPLEIDRHPLSGGTQFSFPAVGLDASHPRLNAGREKLHLVAGADLPGKESAGHHRAEASHGEHPVHGKPERPAR
ncbi:MAG: hypothetical protein A4E69_02262 [Syntrophus sp. PtaB.Bin138]|nr:MAG: hypothetical protein A4E69_02262 [Syntrophus sp. PtaB.Bin138]